LKLSPQGAAERVDETAAGPLNVSGLQSVIDLRTRFGFKLPRGGDIKKYYDGSYLKEATGK